MKRGKPLRRTKLSQYGSRRAKEADALKVFYEAVWKRDEGRCRECGKGPAHGGIPLHAHHLVPRSRNHPSRHDPENGVLLCATWGTREGCHEKAHRHAKGFPWEKWIKREAPPGQPGDAS